MNEKNEKPGCCDEMMSFADGEACEEVRVRMLSKMAESGDVAKQVRHQVQLRGAIKDAMTSETATTCPDDLKAMITGMADEQQGDGGPSLNQGGNQNNNLQEQPAVIGKIGRWIPTAVAAVLLLVGSVVFNQMQSSSSDGTSIASMLPTRLVNLFEKRHVSCTSDLSKLPQDPNLPSKIEALPGALNKRLGSSTSGLDLTGIGYIFDRVGKCTVPGEISVHLIYKPMLGNPMSDAISLWIAPDDGRFEVKPDQVYTVNDGSKAHPILLWKEGTMLYYLVGDSMEVTKKAMNVLRTQENE
ncbi:hypothetical protein JD969_13940 [Planctomycetota bacterium]|nr:hypothetical protein JD969_13940 [Planctomycetota bacterium]